MDRTLALSDQIADELSNIPLEHWGYFFPIAVALWRYIETNYPGRLGALKAGYDSEPWFVGDGAEWFCDVVLNDETTLDAIEALINPILPKLPANAIDRGFLTRNEVPPLAEESVAQLVAAVDRLASSATAGPN